MLIDWFTVIAQAINFLVLMWLLKRFLYKPVLNAIDAREAHIVETVQDAEEQKRTAEAEREAFAKKNEDFDRQRAEFIAQAREEAKAAGERLLEKERATVDAIREKWRSALADEQERFGDETLRRIQNEVFAIVRQVFRDLVDTSLETRMIEVFGHRLRLATEAPDGKLAGVLRTAPKAVRVKSAFALTPTQQASLRQTLSEAFTADVDAHFQTEPDLIGGIELIIDGQRVVWTVEDYLAKLKSDIFELPSGSSSPWKKGKTGKETSIHVKQEGV
ncbi:MAG: F0F1 ATP synthase subunit delta [Planctomycetota bacterium]|jgi:F-type H+-transporting ATPase subunit b|nr:F0F1 ATP synthase subunit delta [Planctomycetota bacterium]